MIGKRSITIQHYNKKHIITVNTTNDACTKFGGWLSGNRLYDPSSRQIVIIEGVQSSNNLVLWATAEGCAISTKYSKESVVRLINPSTPKKQK